MIQRIQSVYLFFSFVILALMLIFPIGMISDTTAQYNFDAFSIVSTSTQQLTTYTIPVAILVVVSAFISLITIFLYNKRMLQKRLGILNMLLMLGLVAVLYIFPNYLSGLSVENVSYELTAASPLISIIFTWLANRGIQKDENLVRSADRIR